ncbi:hypothetical protein [Pseudopedobacter beijingensis]|uniref:Uncharacterized protein n=1 Tax=Pseudopedobacter beijingensis TaxID=1207056 RepID=A0ABW4IB91_9SPHI
MSIYKIWLFLKFGNRTNIKKLYENGTIYMNPIQYFRKEEDGELRGDSYEGAIRIHNYLPGPLNIPEIGFKGNHLGVHLKHSNEEVFGNIYSLYCVSSHGWKHPSAFNIDEKVKNFGSHCLMIKKPKIFISKMENHFKKNKMKFNHNFISYYDKTKINREITLFEKSLEFEYQKEFRFYLERDSIDPFVFNIQGLRDISEIYTTSDILEGLKLEIKKKW